MFWSFPFSLYHIGEGMRLHRRRDKHPLVLCAPNQSKLKLQALVEA